MRTRILVGALLVVAPVLALVAHRAQTPNPSPHASPLVIIESNLEGATQVSAHALSQVSRQRLDALRRSLSAQVAAVDQAEGVREPTPEQAAAIALPAESATAVQMPNGGLALRQDGSALSLLTATVGDDGSVRVTHEAPSQKEVSRDR